MKKKIIVIIVVVAVSTIFTGCGKEEQKTTEDFQTVNVKEWNVKTFENSTVYW